MNRTTRAALAMIVTAAAVNAAPSAARAQAQGYATWSQVESAKETREYKEKLRDGGPLDVSAKTYLVEIALPQLGRETNQRTIDRVRRRMRELLLTEIADDKAFEEASRVVRDFMAALARDGQANPAVQINAMLLIGDLKGRDGKPWPGAAATLAAAARDANLSAGVRVAALAGLARHADSLRTGSDEAVMEFAKAAGPAVLAILAAAAPKTAGEANARSAEAAWMTSRALAILPVVIKAAPKDIAAALAALVDDTTWPVDVRVRAAAALGATATPQSGVNAAAVTEAIRKLAIAALEADVGAAEEKRMVEAYRALVGGQGGFPAANFSPNPVDFAFGGDGGSGGRPTGATVPEQVCRRDAWRLVTLADAILSADGKRGLALLAGKDAEAAKALAVNLRESGISMDATPNEQQLTAAIDGLEALNAQPAAAPQQPAPGTDKPATPAPKEPEAPASPFEASPFG